MTKQHALVTGGAGYIGAVCVEALLAEGWRVTVVDNLSMGHRAAVAGGAEFIELDLCDRAGVLEMMARVRPDVVVHFAAVALVGESMKEPEKYFLNNVAGSANLLEAMAANGVKRLLFSSTCAVYGVPERLPITEETPKAPVNAYGESKLIVERLIDWHGKIHGLKWTVFRYFNAAGATERLGEDHDPETHLLANILRVAAGKLDALEVYGDDYPTPDGTCVRDFVHVRDIAAAHLCALGSGAVGVFNLGAGRGYSINEVLATCREVTGRAIPVVVRPRRAGDPPVLFAEVAKAALELGWLAENSGLRQLVEDAWRWHVAHPEGYPGGGGQ